MKAAAGRGMYPVFEGWERAGVLFAPGAKAHHLRALAPSDRPMLPAAVTGIPTTIWKDGDAIFLWPIPDHAYEVAEIILGRKAGPVIERVAKAVHEEQVRGTKAFLAREGFLVDMGRHPVSAEYLKPWHEQPEKTRAISREIARAALEEVEAILEGK